MAHPEESEQLTFTGWGTREGDEGKEENLPALQVQAAQAAEGAAAYTR